MEKATWFNLPKTATDLTKRIEEGGGLEGTSYVFVSADGTDEENAEILLTAYNTAKTMSPSGTNRITLICANGYYNFENDFVMDTQYIDLVSLDGNRSVIFNGTGTISITANDVFVKGVDVGTKNFTIGDDLNLLKLENCQGGDESFGIEHTASGTFINCIGGDLAFGSYGTASGTFIDCQGGEESFGTSDTASGTFKDCQGGDFSFGNGGTASGTFTDCVGGGGSFGTGGTASGTFTDCQGGSLSFGSDFTGAASGTFTNCVGGFDSFGSGLLGGNGTLNGKLFYCRLTSGTFSTVSGDGITRLCLDGNNNENNQG